MYLLMRHSGLQTKYTHFVLLSGDAISGLFNRASSLVRPAARRPVGASVRGSILFQAALAAVSSEHARASAELCLSRRLAVDVQRLLCTTLPGKHMGPLEALGCQTIASAPIFQQPSHLHRQLINRAALDQ